MLNTHKIMRQKTNMQTGSKMDIRACMEKVRQSGEERLRAFKRRQRLSPQTPEQRQAQIEKARQISAEARKRNGE